MVFDNCPIQKDGGFCRNASVTIFEARKLILLTYFAIRPNARIRSLRRNATALGDRERRVQRQWRSAHMRARPGRRRDDAEVKETAVNLLGPEVAEVGQTSAANQ
jgi:hypothetical protein